MPEAIGDIGGGIGGPAGPGGEGPAGPDVTDASSGAPVAPSCERRLEAAEARSAALASRVRELESALSASEARADQADRRLTSERLLHEAGAIDVETGLLLVESLLQSGACDCPGDAVSTLREGKPFLFRNAAGERAREAAEIPPVSSAIGGTTGAMGAAGVSTAVDRLLEELEDVAVSARESGDRRALLRYLRLRRGAG